MLERIKETASYISSRLKAKPDTAIVLGSGLGGLVNEIEVIEKIPYNEIPHFPVSTVAGHAGMLIFGRLGNRHVLAMQGRFHYYEGWSMQEVTFPFRVMKLMGVETLIISNAAGGLNPDYQVGDIMLISDHINLFPEHPLRGKNEDSLGPRFPDMSEVYTAELRAKAKEKAKELGIHLQEGVYAGVTGPTFETPAEYYYLRVIGADAVGMSTVPEAIVAAHMGMKIIAFSIISDLGIPGVVEKITHEEVLKAAQATEPKLTAVLKGIL